jgi:UDP-N-acetylglucosamine--N-acetylmuramyl-(pentapeptide) pyrophosphoryl-undecaprenol N-acetylglucosamine transferase
MEKSFFFAGGGTGGHLYPAIAVAEQLSILEPKAKILFFCSSRNIDQFILSQTGFEFSILPAKTFPSRPGQVIDFIKSFRQSYKTVAQEITKSKNSVVIGLGGFASGPACLAAHRKKVPLALFNVDIIPGKANQIIARWASDIFVQFADTSKYFTKTKANINVFGCPLRTSFLNPEPANAIEKVNLDKEKKTLLITGASSGSQSINEAVCLILDKLDQFANDWQIVHLSGRNNLEQVLSLYEKAKISHKVLDYYNQMPDLLAAADLVVGRSGAVSVAEFAVASVPSICIPYPHHKDRQQYLNAGKLVEAGAAVIVEDLPDKKVFAENLWKELEVLMKDSQKRTQIADLCKSVARPNAGIEIAKKLIEIAV